jgi:hypothetical protein
MKPFAIGQKNRMFLDTVQGAEVSMKIYSLIETAKVHGMNPGFIESGCSHSGLSATQKKITKNCYPFICPFYKKKPDLYW